MEKVKLTDLKPNKWNPNEMSEIALRKLKNNIKTLGYVDIITVADFQEERVIVDGEHRWRALKELDYKEDIDVMVLKNYTEEELKLLTINLNDLKGERNERSLAEVIDSISKRFDSFADLVAYDKEKLNDLNRLLKQPLDGVDKLQEQKKAEDEEKPHLYSFMVDGERFDFVVMGKMERDIVDSALKKSKGSDRHFKFLNICKFFNERYKDEKRIEDSKEKQK